MTNSRKMDKERDKIMEKVLNLTLEIIFLMTGEDYIIVKKTSYEYMTPSDQPCTSGRCSRSQNPIMKLFPQSLIPKRTNNAKILEVTQKIIGLLTGEVPIRCQDVTVYFSMEEWEYIEGHKDLYKDVMMEKRPPLTSPDGSSNGNPPERCPRPLYSRDSTQEHQEIFQEDQDFPQEIPKEDQGFPQEDQCENLFDLKVEVKVEEEDPCKEEEDPPEISTDRQHNSSIWGTHPVICADGVTEDDDIKYGSSEDDDDDDITSESFEESPITTPNLHSVFHSVDPSNLSAHGWDIPSHSPSATFHKDGTTFPCSQGGEPFTQGEDHTLHQGGKPYSCRECGKRFIRKRNLISHLNSHTRDNRFNCAECGKCFPQRARLFIHQRTHTGVKPYSCSECGKCFIELVRLRSHERTHTGMKPFFCAECGKCFAERSNLNAHRSCHAGVKPYSCSACGKSFHQRRYLISHERTHTGEKPFSCTECGRCFADRSTLARHQRTHSGEKPFSCAVCGKRFTQKSNLITHEKVHTGEKPYSCSECGKCFSRKSYLISHEKTHRGGKS